MALGRANQHRFAISKADTLASVDRHQLLGSYLGRKLLLPITTSLQARQRPRATPDPHVIHAFIN